MKILKIYFKYLRNEAHYQYYTLVLKLFEAYPTVAALVDDLIHELRKWLSVEKALIDNSKASMYTQLLVEADRELDRLLIGFNHAIDSARHHFDMEVVEAARIIDVRMKAFGGSLDKKPYEEEAAAVKVLIGELKTTFYPQITILKLEGWVSAIDQAQQTFEQYFIERNKELANRPQEQLSEVRAQLDVTYHEMVERIDAHNLLNEDTFCQDFVAELNHEVNYFNEHAHRHAKKDISKVTVETIANQVYAGEPVIVLPKVTYEGENLVFARDYEVSYKNNNRPGTATLTIHGKGAFKGTFVTTFNIIVND